MWTLQLPLKYPAFPGCTSFLFFIIRVLFFCLFNACEPFITPLYPLSLSFASSLLLRRWRGKVQSSKSTWRGCPSSLLGGRTVYKESLGNLLPVCFLTYFIWIPFFFLFFFFFFFFFFLFLSNAWIRYQMPLSSYIKLHIISISFIYLFFFFTISCVYTLPPSHVSYIISGCWYS